MRRLLNFLIKYNYWLLFLLLEVASFILLFRFNRYQQSVYFTSANGVIGQVYKMSNGIHQYFGLKEKNEALLDRNVMLEQRVAILEETIKKMSDEASHYVSLDSIPKRGYEVISASVIKNSLTRRDNYITLDKGSDSGITSEMGVVGPDGVAGIVYKTSDHYSLVISLLNSKSSISCKIAGSEYFGYLKWEEGDSQYAYLKDLPRHAEFSIGDTVVTSGYSAVFPAGVVVGRVENMSDSNDGLSYLLKVKLATDFGSLSSVRIIKREGQTEQRELEQIEREKKR